MNEREEYWMNILKCFSPRGYNIQNMRKSTHSAGEEIIQHVTQLPPIFDTSDVQIIPPDSSYIKNLTARVKYLIKLVFTEPAFLVANEVLPEPFILSFNFKLAKIKPNTTHHMLEVLDRITTLADPTLFNFGNFNHEPIRDTPVPLDAAIATRTLISKYMETLDPARKNSTRIYGYRDTERRVLAIASVIRRYKNRQENLELKDEDLDELIEVQFGVIHDELIIEAQLYKIKYRTLQKILHFVNNTPFTAYERTPHHLDVGPSEINTTRAIIQRYIRENSKSK